MHTRTIYCRIFLYSADVWPLTATLTKRLNAAHHRNEEVRVRNGQHSMDDILSERRLRWLGHVIRMDHQRILRQALHWEVPEFKRGPGRPRTN